MAMILTAMLLKAVVDLIVGYAEQAGEIGRATTQRSQPAPAVQ